MNEEKSQDQKPEAKAGVAISVTSTKDIDFPSLGWAIKAGEVRELPADAAAQAAILGSSYITKVKK